MSLYYPTHRSPNLGLPEPLHASGGWLNNSTVEAFQEYAALCYQQLGNWVRYWITINEPNRLVDIYFNGKEKHHAVHNLLLAHAKAWRLYEREYYNQHRAMVSLALHADWVEPANPFLDSHTAAAQRFLLFELGRFLDPLLGTREEEKDGKNEYPQRMKTYLEERARAVGLPGSPLHSFTETEENELRGALSFISLNHFTTRLVAPYIQTQASFQQKEPPDHDCQILSDPTWPSSSLGQAVVPWGFRKILNWVSQRYGGALPIIITASGVDDQAPVEDRLRQHYLRSYLQEALKGETCISSPSACQHVICCTSVLCNCISVEPKWCSVVSRINVDTGTSSSGNTGFMTILLFAITHPLFSHEDNKNSEEGRKTQQQC